MNIGTTLLLSLLLPIATSLSPPIRKVYTFPNNTFIENIAVRHNSNLLITSESVPTLFSICPSDPSPAATVITTISNATGLSGITELYPDVFIFASGIWDLVNTRVTPGSLNLWAVDFNHPTPVTSHITTVANTTIFNGISAIPGTNFILAADSAAGAIWRVDIATKRSDISFYDPLFLPVSNSQGSNLGINGLKYHSGYAYFTNSAQGIFGRVRVGLRGEKLGAVEVIANTTGGAVLDDFDFDTRGNAWIGSHPDFVAKVSTTGALTLIQNQTLLLNPTSAAFGKGSVRERNTLYVTNGGLFDAEFNLYNNGVVAVDLAGVGW